MGQGIKNRIFGSDIPVAIKRKIEARQELAYKDHQPHEQIQSEYGTQSPNAFKDFGALNTDGVSDLSSRTPFIRMWTAVEISRAEDQNKTVTEEDFDKWWKDNISIDKPHLDKFLVTSGEDEWKEMKWKKYSDSQKIYQLGNNVLNTEMRSPNAPVTGAVGSGNDKIPNSVIVGAMPYEQESDYNAFLKPPAGITSLTSETEGTMGAIKKTTVNFIVHNFDDFQNIYLRFFMKPGSQVFVDFG